ncbi:MAG: neutral zinc metallopeptidase [Archangium sp.]
MELDNQRRSSNVEDRRGVGGRGLAIGGGLGTLVVAGIALLLGADPREVFDAVSSSQPTQSAPVDTNDEGSDFVRAILGSTEDTWGALFERSGSQYPQPKLVLFREVVDSACGSASSATGPFYCPRDRKVYLDLSFFDDLARRFKAPGDFAQAYVIAHEIGHHVQTVTGVEAQMRQLQQGATREEQNALSVRLELQADCYAGVWAHHAQKSRPFLQEGDVEEALGAASAIGDDRLQQQARGRVVPESFTHGSSAQRVKWFRTGFDSGSVKACDTFSN